MNAKPLIYDFIEKKLNDKQLPFKYSEEHDLNVVHLNGRTVPFVKLAKESIAYSNNLEVMTKTFTKREDEEGNEIACLLEFLTKTKQDRESEEDNNIPYLLEFMTKTEQAREDDESKDTFMSMQNIYELYTKTRQNRESESETMRPFKYKNELCDLL